MLSLAARRWASQWKLFALVLVVAIVAGSVLAGTLLLVRSGEQAGVRAALSSIPAENVDVTVRVLDPPAPVSETRSAVDAATAEAFGSGTEWSSTAWVTTAWVTTTSNVFSYLAEIDDPQAAAALVDGVWPDTWPGVAVPESAALSLGLSVGDSLAFDDDDRSITVRVDGIYRADTSSGIFWENDPLLAEGDKPQFGEPGKSFGDIVHAIGPLLLPTGGADASGVGATQLGVTEHPSFAGVGVSGLDTLAARLADAESTIGAAVLEPRGAVIIDTSLGTALSDVSAGLNATRAAALTVLLLLLVVVVMVLSTATRLLADARAPEFALLGERGASVGQRAGAVAVDALVVGLVVAAVSPWGGAVVHAMVSAVPSLATAGFERWVQPGRDEWVAVAALAAVVSALICVPSARRGDGRSADRGATTRVALETIVVVSAIVLLWRAAAQASTVGDPLLAATPAVLVLASGMMGVRIVSAALRPAAAVFERTRGAVAPLAGWYAARRPGRGVGLLVVAAGIGAAVVVAGSAATWQQSLRDLATVAVGPPVRLDGPAAVDAVASGVGAPVTRGESLISRVVVPGLEIDVPFASAQVLGLSPDARSLLPTEARGRGDIIRGLPPAGAPDSGPALPAGTREVRAIVDVTAPAGVYVDVSVVTASDKGVLTVSSLGETAPDLPAHEMTATVDPDAAGSRLVGVMARVDSDAEGSGRVSIALSAIATAKEAGGSPSIPLDLSDAGGWAGSSSNGDDFTGVEVTATGVTIAAPVILGGFPTTLGAVGWEPVAQIAAVVPESMADHLDVTAGGDITSFVAGSRVTFRMTGTTAGVPGAASAEDLAALEAGLPAPSRAESTIVVDGTALVHQLVQASAPGRLVDEVWTDGTAVSSQSLDGAVDTESFGERMLDAPLRAVLPVSFVLVVAAGFLLALVGFSAQTAASIQARRLESAQLRALGMSQRGMTAVALADATLAAVAGAVVGLVAGLGTLAFVGTRLVTAPGWTAVDLVLPWQMIAVLPVLGAAVLVVTLLVIQRAQRGLPLADLLRSGASE